MTGVQTCALPISSRYRKLLEEARSQLPNFEHIEDVQLEKSNELIARASVFVNTSLCYEGFPNTFIQAWMRKVPTVTLNFDAAKLAVGWRFLARKNVGQGQTVLLLPGFGASSSSMTFIKRYLDSLGYKAVHWSAGFNHGEVGKLLPQVIGDIKEHSEQAQAPIKLLGWSLGGYLAREAAREVQQNVSRIVTIGSPVIGGPKYTAVKALYDIRGLDVESIENSTLKRFEHPIVDRKSTRLNSSHMSESRMPSSA